LKIIRYIRLDIDNVGDKIELALLDEDIDKANAIHQSVQAGMNRLRQEIESHANYSILMAGCDDLLILYKSESEDVSFLSTLKELFQSETSFTMSMGIGENLQEALMNLRKAKYLGKNIIIR